MDHKYELIKACDKGVRLRRREEERDSAAIYRSKHLPETLFLPGRPVLKRKHAGFMKSGFIWKLPSNWWIQENQQEIRRLIDQTVIKLDYDNKHYSISVVEEMLCGLADFLHKLPDHIPRARNRWRRVNWIWILVSFNPCVDDRDQVIAERSMH